jgi:transglutaminase-like putative cysteine protease
LTLSTSAPSIKATAEDIAAALEDTFEHPHRDPAVRTLLSRAMGGRRLSRHKTADTLIAYLKNYLVYDDHADPESVVALINTRHGVCRHFADLLTTLLRASDIPARSVSGLACGGGAEFGGHRWTELVLEDGTRLGVDPTLGQMRTTAHVRLPSNDEGRFVLLELDHLDFDVEQVSRSHWLGWQLLVVGVWGGRDAGHRRQVVPRRNAATGLEMVSREPAGRRKETPTAAQMPLTWKYRKSSFSPCEVALR